MAGRACMEQWAGQDGWACRLPGAVLAVQPFWGASPVGPYNRNRTGGAMGRIHQVGCSLPRSTDCACMQASTWNYAMREQCVVIVVRHVQAGDTGGSADTVVMHDQILGLVPVAMGNGGLRAAELHAAAAAAAAGRVSRSLCRERARARAASFLKMYR